RGVGDRSVDLGGWCDLGEVLGGEGLSKLSGDSGGHGQTTKRRSDKSREEPHARELGFSRHDREDGNQNEGQDHYEHDRFCEGGGRGPEGICSSRRLQRTPRAVLSSAVAGGKVTLRVRMRPLVLASASPR